MNIEPNTLSRAIVIFLGHGVTSYPDHKHVRITDEFGAELASQLEPKVRRILNDLNNLKPDWSIHSFDSACIWAREEMHRSHPELDQLALNALEWTFSWGWK